MATEPGSHRLAHWRTSGVDHGDRSPSGRFADTHAQRRCQIVQRRCAGLLIPRVLYQWFHEFILLIQQIKVTAYGASYGAPMITIEDGLYRISPWMRTLLHLTMDAIQVHQSIVHSSDTIPHMAFEWINDAPYVDPIRCVGSRLKVSCVLGYKSSVDL